MLDHATVRELLHYDPATGNFRRRARDVRWFKDGKQSAAHNCAIWNGKFAGKVAGYASKSREGRHTIRIFDELISAAKLAWLYMTGDFPSGEVDHENCDPSDNRWCNLRNATHEENGRNTRKRKNNTSGYKGVSQHRGQWRARISVRGKFHCLGLYDTPAQAHSAYAEAAIRLHGKFARME